MYSNNFYAAVPLLFFYLFTGMGKVIFSITYSFSYFFRYGISSDVKFHSSNNIACQSTLLERKNKEHQNINLCFQNKTPLKRLTTFSRCAAAV
jgi:hypothetical protein